MRGYAWAAIRYRKAGFVAAFLALCCAAALVAGCGTLLETGLRGTIGTERFAAAPVIVGGDQSVHHDTVEHEDGKTKVERDSEPLAERVWLPSSTVDRLRGLPGARAVLPEVTFPAHALSGGRVLPGTGGAPSYGHGWDSAALTPFTLASGRAPRSASEVVVDAELATRAHLLPGSRVQLEAAADEPRTYTVTGIAHAEGGGLAAQTSLFFSADEARRLAGHGTSYDAVGLLPKPGVSANSLAEQAERALHGTTARVVTGKDRGPVEFLDAADARVELVSLSAVTGGTGLLVAVLVVSGTFALSIQQRQRELALLRAVAATPRQARRLIGSEALLVGLVAGVLGALAGPLVGRWLYGRLVGIGVVPDTLDYTYGPLPLAVGAVAALLGGWAAARASARRVTRIRPTEALSEAAVEPSPFTWGRTLPGMLVLAGGIVLVVVLRALHTEGASIPVTYVTVVLLCIAVALLGPLIATGATALLRGPLALLPVGGHLAAANARASVRRVAATVTPLTLLVAMASTVFFVGTTMEDASRDQAREGTRAGWVLDSSGPGVPHGAAAAVAGVPGVRAVTELVGAQVLVGLDDFRAQGVTAKGLADTWDPDVSAGSLDGFGPGSVALGDRAAGQLHKKPGDKLTVTLGDGVRATLRVAAVYRRDLGFGDMTMDAGLISRHVDQPLPAMVLVAGHVSHRRLDAAVADYPGVLVVDSGRIDALGVRAEGANAAINYLAMGLVVAFTAIAVVNTLAMSVSARGGEFALLRLVGTTRRQVMRMLGIEAAIVLLIAVVLGTGIAYAVLSSFSAGMTGRGAPAPDIPVYAATLFFAALLAAVASWTAGRHALAERPADALGERT